jgi:hypothetical protein
MGSFGKNITILLIIVVGISCLSLLLVKPSDAQTEPKTPEFTLRLESHPYDVAPTTSIDPYTGKTIVTQEGYHAENKSIEIVIKNQYFVPYRDSNGNSISLMYNIRWKGHFDTTDSWTYFAGTAHSQEYTRDFFRPTNAEYNTWVATLSLYEWEKRIANYNYIIALPPEGQTDFQVEALIGYSSLITGQSILSGETSLYKFTGITSGWSNTQTINLAEGSVSISTSPTPTSSPTSTTAPSVPEFSWLAILPLLLAMLSIAVIVRHRKTANSNKTSTS